MARKRRQSAFNLAGYAAIFAVVITIAVVTWVRGMSLQEQLDNYDIRKEQLNEMIVQEENRTNQIEERRKYMQTKQYIEDVAREKVGLVYPDEIMFKSNK